MSYSDERTDAELLTEFCEGGDPGAFASLVKRHSPMVHAVSMRVMSNYHDAQDVTQAVFLVLAREASKLNREPSVGGWLHTVARRLSLNAQKSRASRKHREEKAMIDYNDTAPDQIESKEFRAELDAALNRLPDRYRQPLVLFHLEGASLNEVAAQLALNPNTVGTNLSRARDLLRRALNRHGIKTASVGALSALLAVEAKAASPISPTLYSSILETTTNPGASISSNVLHLAEHASIPSISSASILPILMKTKTTIIVASCALFITGATLIIVNDPNDKGSENQNSIEDSQRGRSSRGESNTRKGRNNKLAGTSNEAEFDKLLNSVALIKDDAARLEAIRNRLGIDLTNEEYNQLVKKVGFQNDPEVFGRTLFDDYLFSDPQKLIEWGERLEEGTVKDQIPHGVIEALSITDKEAAMKYARENLDQDELDGISQYIDRLNAKAQADAKARTEFSGEKLREMSTQYKALKARSREISAEISGLTDLQGWEKFLQRREELSDEKRKLESKSQVLDREIFVSIRFLAESNPKAAVEMALELHLGSLEIAMQKFAPMDPDAAYAFALEVEDPNIREAALVVALPPLILKDPKTEIDPSLLSEKGQGSVITKVIEDWALEDSRAAMDYAIAQEHPALKSTAIKAATTSWAKKDSDALDDWVAHLPAGEVLQAVLPVMARNASRTDFKTARNFLEKIQDQETKQDVMEVVVMHGLEQDLDAALDLAAEIEKLDSLRVNFWLGIPTDPEKRATLEAWIENGLKTGKIRDSNPDIPVDGIESQRLQSGSIPAIIEKN